MLVLVLGGGLRDDDVSTLSGRRVEDRVVVVARAALATHVVEEQLAELVAVAGCLTHLMKPLSMSRFRCASVNKQNSRINPTARGLLK